MEFCMIFFKCRPGGRVETMRIWCKQSECVDAFKQGLEQGYASYSVRGSR